MTRLLIGFFFGLMVAAAVGQGGSGQTITEQLKIIANSTVPASGVGPNGQPSVIKVDAEGRVICSPESLR